KFNEKSNELKDAFDDLSELKDFYSNQKQTWELLRNNLTIFKVNQTALEKDPGAKKALNRMIEIFNTPHPYGMLKDVNTLISTVQNVNDTMVKKHRESAVIEIDTKIKSLAALLDQHDADKDLRNKMLLPLQDIKKQIQTESSIPQIAFFVKDAQETFEDKWEEIENIDDGNGGEPPKQVTQIKVSEFKDKPYLESEHDVDTFIRKLKNALLEAIKRKMKIKIE
ncbi:MAG TPA: hypothetical protein VJ346_00625, partial [Bacteroidales bacterium]|nr:hypothetical protein [Bacteroidales bacterium]